MNRGAIGAFTSAIQPGMQAEQDWERSRLQNQGIQVRNAWEQGNVEAGQQRDTEEHGQPYGPPVNQLSTLQEPVLGRVYDWLKSKMTGQQPGQTLPGNQHAVGPAAQATVPGQSNVAASRPGPTSSNAASPGIPSATGAIPAEAQGQATVEGFTPISQYGSMQGIAPRGQYPGTPTYPAYDDGGAVGSRNGVTPMKGVPPRRNRARNTESTGMPALALADGGEPPQGKTAGSYTAQGNPTEQEIKDFGGRSQSGEASAPAPEAAPPAGEAAQPGALSRGAATAGHAIPGYLAGAAGIGAANAYNTPTETMAGRMGVKNPSSFWGDVGVRTLGTLQDVGNAITGGLADRAGNWLSGGGFKPSYDPGSPALPQRGAPPPASAPTPAAAAPQAPARNAQPGAPATAPKAHPAAGVQTAPDTTHIDMTSVNADHSEIPSITPQDWAKYRQSAYASARAQGQTPDPMALNERITEYQQKNFQQYISQGAALDAAGDKAGAMRAYRMGYQYLPNGHDVTMGTDKQGNIIGYGIDQGTGKPVGTPVLLDQKNVNGILEHFADPKNFREATKDWQEIAMRPKMYEEVTKPLAKAEEAERYGRGQYYRENVPGRIAAAQIRAEAVGSRLSAQSQKFYASQINPSVMDPGDQGDALRLAEALEEREGRSDAQTQGKIAGMVKELYSNRYTPEQRQQVLQQYLGGESAGVQQRGPSPFEAAMETTPAGIPGRPR